MLMIVDDVTMDDCQRDAFSQTPPLASARQAGRDVSTDIDGELFRQSRPAWAMQTAARPAPIRGGREGVLKPSFYFR